MAPIDLNMELSNARPARYGDTRATAQDEQNGVAVITPGGVGMHIYELREDVSGRSPVVGVDWTFPDDHRQLALGNPLMNDEGKTLLSGLEITPELLSDIARRAVVINAKPTAKLPDLLKNFGDMMVVSAKARGVIEGLEPHRHVFIPIPSYFEHMQTGPEFHAMIVTQMSPTVDIERSKVTQKTLNGKLVMSIMALIPEQFITNPVDSTGMHLWRDSVVRGVYLTDQKFYDSCRAAELIGLNFLANGNR